MVGPAKPRTPTFKDMMNAKVKGYSSMPGRVIDPNLREINETIRAANAFNDEREFRSSPNHKPRRKLDMDNVARHVVNTLPTLDRMEIETGDLGGGSGLQDVSSKTDVTAPKIKAPPGVNPNDLVGMPKAFAGRPKLTMLWLKGQGKLPAKISQSLDKHFADGNMRLSDDDWIALETVVPSQSEVMNWPKDKVDAFKKRYGNAKGPVDPYLQTLIADVNRKQEVDKVMDGIRTTAIGTFGIIGGIAGSGAGPAGTIVGGAGGVAMGSSLTDGVENVTKMVLDKLYPTGAEHETGRYRTVKEMTERALTEGAIDGAVGGLGIYAAPVAKKLGQKILGITDEGRMTQEQARKLGISTLPVQVGRDFWVGATNVLARMPLIGGPLRTKLAEQNLEIENFLGTLPGRMSMKNFSDPDVGVEMDIVAQQAFEKTMTVLRGKQLKLKQAAAKLGAFVNTGETRRVAEKWLNHYSTMEVDKPDPWVIKKLEAIIDSTQGKVTLDKWDTDIASGIRRSKAKLESSKGVGDEAFTELLEVAKDDLNSSGVWAQKQIVMDNEFNAALERFQSLAAKKFETLDANRFREGVMKLGSKNPDELVGMLTSRNSPKFVFDVRAIVGNDVMKDLGSRYLANKIAVSKSATGTDGFSVDFNKMAKELGLDDPKGNQFGVTKEMLRNSGVTMDMLQDFMKAAKVSSRAPVPKASTFLARSLVFSGYGSALTALTLSGGPPGLLGGLAFTLVARKGAKILADPEMIKLATISMDVKKDAGVRRTSLLRLYRMVAPEAFEGGQEHGMPDQHKEAHQHLMDMGRALVR